MTPAVRLIVMTLIAYPCFVGCYIDPNLGFPLKSFNSDVSLLLLIVLLALPVEISRRARRFVISFRRAAEDYFRVFARIWFLAHLLLVPLVLVSLSCLDLTLGDCLVVAEATALFVGLTLAIPGLDDLPPGGGQPQD